MTPDIAMPSPANMGLNLDDKGKIKKVFVIFS
jgi:hypothetical protein